MVHQPVHPYRLAEGWLEYHRAIADAVPELGVVPYIRSERVIGAQIADLGDRCPNVIGVKYGVEDPVRFAAVARDAGLDRFAWLAGLAELSPPATGPGARGFTSGLVNVAQRCRCRCWERCAAATRQGDGHLGADPAVRGAARRRRVRGQRSVVKEALAQLGPVRPGRARRAACAAAERDQVGPSWSWGRPGLDPAADMAKGRPA